MAEYFVILNSGNVFVETIIID